MRTVLYSRSYRGRVINIKGKHVLVPESGFYDPAVDGLHLSDFSRVEGFTTTEVEDEPAELLGSDIPEVALVEEPALESIGEVSVVSQGIAVEVPKDEGEVTEEVPPGKPSGDPTEEVPVTEEPESSTIVVDGNLEVVDGNLEVVEDKEEPSEEPKAAESSFSTEPLAATVVVDGHLEAVEESTPDTEAVDAVLEGVVELATEEKEALQEQQDLSVVELDAVSVTFPGSKKKSAAKKSSPKKKSGSKKKSTGSKKKGAGRKKSK